VALVPVVLAKEAIPLGLAGPAYAPSENDVSGVLAAAMGRLAARVADAADVTDVTDAADVLAGGEFRGVGNDAIEGVTLAAEVTVLVVGDVALLPDRYKNDLASGEDWRLPPLADALDPKVKVAVATPATRAPDARPMTRIRLLTI
jgi:hypothetical protein